MSEQSTTYPTQKRRQKKREKTKNKKKNIRWPWQGTIKSAPDIVYILVPPARSGYTSPVWPPFKRPPGDGSLPRGGARLLHPFSVRLVRDSISLYLQAVLTSANNKFTVLRPTTLLDQPPLHFSSKRQSLYRMDKSLRALTWMVAKR